MALKSLVCAGLVAQTILFETLIARPQTISRSNDARAKVAFEVEAVKRYPNDGGATGVGLRGLTGKRWVAENVSLFELVRAAYGHRYPLKEQIVGGPTWLWSFSERFSVNALANDLPTESVARLMLQELLARRFGLVVHVESRLLPAYALVSLSKRPSPGRGMRLVDVDCQAFREARGEAVREARELGNEPSKLYATFKPGDPIPVCSPTTSDVGIRVGRVASGDATMAQLATVLSTVVGRPVVDRSGLVGSYTFHLLFSISPGPTALPANGQAPLPANAPVGLPSLFAVVQDELGMKLDPRNELIDVLVIDKASYPIPD